MNIVPGQERRLPGATHGLIRLAGGLLTGLFLCQWAGCARSSTGIVTVAEPIPLRWTEVAASAPQKTAMGGMLMTRLPAEWRVKVVRRHKQDNGWAVVLALRTKTFKEVVVSVEPPWGTPRISLSDIKLMIHLSFDLDSKPAINARTLRRKYPDDKAFAWAFVRLSPGDPAKEGRWLTAAEQEDSLLAHLLGYELCLRVPSHIRSADWDVFISGTVQEDPPTAMCIAWMFARRPGPSIPSKIWFSADYGSQDDRGSFLQSLMELAARFCACLDPGQSAKVPGAP